MEPLDPNDTLHLSLDIAWKAYEEYMEEDEKEVVRIGPYREKGEDNEYTFFWKKSEILGEAPDLNPIMGGEDDRSSP